MKRLRLCMILFLVLIGLPLTYVVWRTYEALNQESMAQVRFFSDRLLDEIESELADMVGKEEKRAVDEYRHVIVRESGTIRSPLAQIPKETFILGYFQNNPDGTFQTPLMDDRKTYPPDLSGRIRQLQSINSIFNQRKRVAHIPEPESEMVQKPIENSHERQRAFADRFLRTSETKVAKDVLGQKKARVEAITAGQAMNLVQNDKEMAVSLKREQTALEVQPKKSSPAVRGAPMAPTTASDGGKYPSTGVAWGSTLPDTDRFQVEVAPLQTVVVDEDRVFIFRRISIGGRIYRQGVVLVLRSFLEHLFTKHYDSQPIARYASLSLQAVDIRMQRNPSAPSHMSESGDWVIDRMFPAPFSFLTAEMRVINLPPSFARKTLNLALAVLGIVLVLGLFTIYHNVRTILELSERRSRFVSAVTHELKTPLTNIRLYVEMLEQGIAATPEREKTYLGILASESARLSGLINNVLELSRLEKQTRQFNYTQGDLSDVFSDIKGAMEESLARAGFDLTIRVASLPVFAYDREVLAQVLINLMENSIKFGRHLPEKRIVIYAEGSGSRVRLSVSDTGPGIPERSLKHIFEDFYRVDNELSKNTGGTGIGLALVKKLVLAMGGRIWAENNDGAGCTISIQFPGTGNDFKKR